MTLGFLSVGSTAILGMHLRYALQNAYLQPAAVQVPSFEAGEVESNKYCVGLINVK